jgi:PhnB protein
VIRTAYQACKLGDVTELIRHGEMGPVRNDAWRGLIMHARFDGPGLSFFASDNDDAEPMRGIALFIQLQTADQVRSTFSRLSEGGVVTTPLGPQPWSALYGKATDRFGVQWMINQQPSSEAQPEPSRV